MCVCGSTMTQTVLNRGSVGGDLLVYFHIDPSLLQPMAASFADDALVVELAGNGTSAYRGLVVNSGGWSGYTSALMSKLVHGVQRTAVVSWSAGSQAAAESVMGGATPDVLVMLDGLYAPKQAGSKPGDGRVQWTPELEAVAKYATRAARGEKTCVILHSRIPTPYASSKECAEAVQAAVEKVLGMKMQPAIDVTPTQLDGHTPAQTLVLGNLRILEFPGANGAEHITQAHLWDEVCKLWVPWLFTPTSTSPEVTPVPATMPTRVLQRGSRGQDVTTWQRALIRCGIDVGSTSADSIFGARTELATREVQQRLGRTVDGIVTASLWETVANTVPVPTTLSDAILVAARADLVAGIREDWGHNDGPMIRKYSAPFDTPPGSNWCALAVADWIHRGAVLLGVEPPIAGSPGAKATMDQIMAADGCLWFDVDALRANPALVKPGMVPVWDRSDKTRPETSWWGHIGVVSSVGTGGTFKAIEGNSGAASDRVTEMARSLNDVRLLGMGWLG